MNDLFFRPPNAWVGDLIPFHADGAYYLFYLHDPRKSPKRFAEETTWHFLTSKDFATFQYHGEAIARGGDERPNRDVYTGSVIRDTKGQYHAFFTGYNPKITKDGKGLQFIMKATGDDLFSLKTDDSFLLPSDDQIYEPWDWRDPFVFWNEQELCYWMLVTTREQGAGALRGGCIGLCKSSDLVTWSYSQPFYSPKMYITMECSEIFQMGEWWYLVFSTFSDRFVTHYRIARSLTECWTIPPYDTFDCRAAYAIKTSSDGTRRFASGWIASKDGLRDGGAWDWGGTMVHHEIIQNPTTGELSVIPPPALRTGYTETIPGISPILVNAHRNRDSSVFVLESDTLGAALLPVPTDDRFALGFEVEPIGTQEFGIALHCDLGLESGYFLRFDLISLIVAWDRWPRASQGSYQWQIQGDHPYQIESATRIQKAERYFISLYREDTVCVVYINNSRALSFPLYDFKGGNAGPYVIQGSLSVLRWSSFKQKEEPASADSKRNSKGILS